jgi:hypothetical protein
MFTSGFWPKKKRQIHSEIIGIARKLSRDCIVDSFGLRYIHCDKSKEKTSTDDSNSQQSHSCSKEA